MLYMKYISYVDLNDNETFIMFPSILKHSDMTRYIRYSHILGAGFVVSNDVGIVAYGESESLKIKSRPEDTKLINLFNNINNFQWKNKC